MSARLIISLPAEADGAIRWALCSAFGDVLASGEGLETFSLPAGVTVSATVAIIPAGHVHVRRLVMPARSDNAARQAAPFALEEYLASPLDTQRITCGAADDTGARWVAALDTSLAERWQNALEALAIRPVFAISEALLLDPAVGELALAVHGASLLWRYRAGAEDAAGSIPEALADMVVPALIASHQPARITLAGGESAERLELGQTSLHRSGPLDIVQAAASLDMAQLQLMPALFGARLAASLDWSSLLKPWRRVAVLAVAAGALALAGVTTEAAWLSRQAELYQTASMELFAGAFPDTRRIVNPRAQLARRLRELEAMDAGGAGFLPLAGALAEATQDLPGIQIVAVRFEAGQAALSVSARYGSFDDFEALRGAGETAGLDIADAGARQSADGVSGEFVVRWRE
ncbi:type II secretion system protein GspL [Glycocaulis abyssi]|uniref:Type II secretion system protein GspL n=1 Tax=Glycocaulis abyssi TaxID=1433403 RepID=A0ABV9NBB9_9PROT